MAQNDSEWPIFPDSQLFQSFPTKVAQNDYGLCCFGTVYVMCALHDEFCTSMVALQNISTDPDIWHITNMYILVYFNKLQLLNLVHKV